jgi:hypothetical protein
LLEYVRSGLTPALDPGLKFVGIFFPTVRVAFNINAIPKGVVSHLERTITGQWFALSI